MTDIRWKNKTRFGDVAHEQITDPFGILAIRLVGILWFCVLEVSKCDKTGVFKDVEDRDPIFAKGFHADFCTVVSGKPFN